MINRGFFIAYGNECEYGVVKTLSLLSLDYAGISHTLYLSRFGLREHYAEHYKSVIHSVIFDIEEISDAKRIAGR